VAQILIVEDDPALQEAYSFILKTSGHAVSSAFNGAEGLEQVATQDFDVILLDIHMPVMDGLEFLKRFQPNQPKSTRVIVFSNMVEPDIEAHACKLGAHRCVLKSSMTPRDMLGLIEQTVGATA
jgi:CheY-like chemotaxis protein